MKVTKILAVIGCICVAGFAPLAMAQSAMTPAPSAKMAPATMAPAPAPAMPAPAATTPSAGNFPKSDAFKSKTDAMAHCPNDTVVWSTMSKSNSFHTASSRYYGKTKHGAYVCKGDAVNYGFHAAKS